MTYRLNIHKIDQSCLFELTWGKGRRLTASLPYPPKLTTHYQTWRQAYLGYYKQGMRGKVGVVGQVSAPTVDWHSQVVQAEARLLSEFHRWLKHANLFDLREELTRAQLTAGEKTELFLACEPIETARLPWETWEFGQHIQIVRSPAAIRAETLDRRQFRQGKTRVLAIMGDETELNFEQERRALNDQRKLLEIHYIGWQPHEDAVALKQEICQKITDPKGWDVLFFAGHSNEETLLDGQIAIAPKTFLSIKELSPYLKQAQQRGLQFALFNSCSGLDIANGVINLGISQAAIMREPIHNEVAQTFLVQLLKRLAAEQNVQEALLGVCQFLKLEKHLTYPSAYLAPTLFRHPESVPYRIPPTGWRTFIKRWTPNKREVLTVVALAVLSLFPQGQNWLLNQRLGIQARYRDWTTQQGPTNPPIVLVQIDDRTLQERLIAAPNPIDRTLLADIATTLTHLNANVISIDYVLDRPQPKVDPALKQAFEQAVAQQVWLVLATKQSHLGEWLSVSTSLASPNWILQGDIWSPMWHIRPRGWSDQRPLPFSYQAAIAYHLVRNSTEAATPNPSLENLQSLQSLVASYLEELGPEKAILSQRSVLHPITNLAYPIRQRWLQPLLDFSLPPDQVYRTIPAWRLLQDPEQILQDLDLSSLQNRVVIVAAGGYDEAGFAQHGEDNLEQPAAIAYWRRQADDGNAPQGFTGGELNAYMTHHFLSNHLITPIPDFWLVLAAALIGKGLAIRFGATRRRPFKLGIILVGATMAYGWASLQLYISAGVMAPWLLPSLTIGLYGAQFIQETKS